MTWYCRPAGSAPPPPTPQPAAPPPSAPPPPPPDRDADGVPDSSDACPDAPAPGSANGCPVQAQPDTAAAACGTERWVVKTLQDDAAGLVKFTPVDTTVNALLRKRPPDIGDATRGSQV